MTGQHGIPDPAVTPWGRYLRTERAARDVYLNITARAQAEYLDGPWPDRDAYEKTERAAWAVYNRAGRDAWHAFTHDTWTEHVYTRNPALSSLENSYLQLEHDYGLTCFECGVPWRSASPNCPRRENDVHPLPRAAHPYPVSEESSLSVADPVDQPASGPTSTEQ